MNRLQAAREACYVPPEERTEEHISALVPFVHEVKIFSQIAEAEVRALCRTVILEELPAKEYVFRVNEVGDKCYIILTGSASVHIPSSESCPNGIHPAKKCTCPERSEDTVINLERGVGFGELALFSDAKRSASVQTAEPTELLVVTRAHYERFAGALHRQFIANRVSYLRQFPRIEAGLQKRLMGAKDIAAVANCLQERSMTGGEPILRQGEAVEGLVFVRSGQLAILRVVDLDRPCEADGRPMMMAELSPTHEADEIFGATEALEEAVAAAKAASASPKGDDMPNALEQRWGRGAMLVQPLRQFAMHLANNMAEVRRRDGDEKPPWAGTRAVRRIVMAAKNANRHGEDSGEEPQRQASAEGGEGFGRRTSVDAGGGGEEGPPMVAAATCGEQPHSSARGKALWDRFRSAFRQARIFRQLQAGASGGWKEAGRSKDPTMGYEEGNEDEAGNRHIQQLLDISAAERRLAECKYKALSEKRKNRQERERLKLLDSSSRRSTMRRKTGQSLGVGGLGSTVGATSRKVVLRIGTLTAFQYFGDRQIAHSEKSPVTLVCDPTAEVYVLRQQDIQRRFPKRLFAEMFTPDRQMVPNDVQILQLHRQTERWDQFRKSVYPPDTSRDRLLHFGPGPPPAGAPRRAGLGGRGGPSRGGGLSAAATREIKAKLDVFGQLAPEFSTYVARGTTGAGLPGALTSTDIVHYSQATAHLLRNMDRTRLDPELRRGLASDGQKPRRPGSAGGRQSIGAKARRQDPTTFHFEMRWAEVEKLTLGLDGVGDNSLDLVLKTLMSSIAVPEEAEQQQAPSKSPTPRPARDATSTPPPKPLPGAKPGSAGSARPRVGSINAGSVRQPSKMEAPGAAEPSVVVGDESNFSANMDLPPVTRSGATSAAASRAASAMGAASTHRPPSRPDRAGSSLGAAPRPGSSAGAAPRPGSWARPGSSMAAVPPRPGQRPGSRSDSRPGSCLGSLRQSSGGGAPLSARGPQRPGSRVGA